MLSFLSQVSLVNEMRDVKPDAINQKYSQCRSLFYSAVRFIMSFALSRCLFFSHRRLLHNVIRIFNKVVRFFRMSFAFYRISFALFVDPNSMGAIFFPTPPSPLRAAVTTDSRGCRSPLKKI